jgi:hypothetical protein
VNYITFAVLFTSPKCAFLAVFKAVFLLWIMMAGHLPTTPNGQAALPGV